MNGYKTFIIALVSVIGGIATAAGYGIPEDMLNELAAHMTAVVGGLMFLYGVVMWAFRAITNKPLFDGKSHMEVFMELLKLIPAVLGKKGGSDQGGFVRMALLPVLIAAALGLSFLPGCSVLGDLKPIEPIAVPQSLPQTGQEAQKIINEANVALAAAANVIAENTRAGVWDKPTAQHYLDQVKDYADKVDKAQTYLTAGDYGNAQSQAQLINTLILTLSKEVAAKARKEPQ